MRIVRCLRPLLLLLTVCLGTVGVLTADPAPGAKLNKKIDNVVFKDAAGKALALHDLEGKKAIVVVFLSFDCPVSNSYAQPLADLAKGYAERGVAVLGVCPGDEDAAVVAKQVQEFKLPFPVSRDERGALADAFKAEVTPEAFVLDH